MIKSEVQRSRGHSLVGHMVAKMEVCIKWRLITIAVVALVIVVDRVKSDAEVMKKMTMGFVKALEDCKKELNLPDHIIQDFYNYWKEDYELLNREVGCAIMCMASKLNLINEADNRLHHENAHSFATSHGADDEMAKKVISIIHECEKIHAGIKDDCERVLEASKCFRSHVHSLKWAPSMEVAIEEFMTSV